MEERKVADYFVVAGLPFRKEPLDEFAKDGFHLKSSHNRAPITDIAVIFPTLGEAVPEGYTLLKFTPTGLLADLNHGSLRSPEVHLCYRRGRDKPPLVDIGVMYEGKERILEDSEVVEESPSGKAANVNNSGAKTLLTFRRAPATMPCNSLVVTDICVIIANKGETPPHAFCMIKKNLNKGLVGNDVYICYKKSMNRANLISYKPGILERYPCEDNSKFPLPSSVPMFCLPMGCTLERWPASAQEPSPIFSTFVLTVSDASEKLYGSAVTFYERYPVEELTTEQLKSLEENNDDSNKNWSYNTNKCICLLSRWPFFDTFEKFLMFIYEMSTDKKSHPVPIERFISYLLEDVPFPSPQRPRILVQLSAAERLIMTQPEELPLPRSGAGFRQLLINLGPENCLLLLLCALTEQKILVHSLRPDVLTAVAEAISMMVFPFKWQCPYIPLCPLSLAEVLNAPLPFLIGVDSRFFDLYDPPSDVNCVDLDTNSITVCEDRRHLVIKILPKKPGRILKMTLEHLLKNCQSLIYQTMQHSSSSNQTTENSIDKDFQLKQKEQGLELEIQEAFLHFMATVLKGYRSFLLPITKAPTLGTTDTNSLFDLQGFLRSRDKANLKFFSMVTRTQMFIRFIEERSFVSDMDASLAFFDECTEKVESEDDIIHFFDIDDSHRSERTVLIMPPEPLTVGQRYFYDKFVLSKDLFCGSDSKKGENDGVSGVSNMKISNLVERFGSATALAPGSPMARRTKHEIKVSQRLARKYSHNPHLWARYLVATCYSIWFIHLPSFVMSQNKTESSSLRYAYDLLCRVHKTNLTHVDEVCYRVMMQLCGVYSQPVVAVKLLFLMKRANIQPNAITYGFYNRAVLEATWPSGMSTSSQLLWNKLRNVIVGAALFREAGGRNATRRKLSISQESSAVESPLLLPETSITDDSHSDTKSQGDDSRKEEIDETIHSNEEESDWRHLDKIVGFAAFDKFRSRVGSIVRPTGLPLISPGNFQQESFESSAGVLMTSGTGPGLGTAASGAPCVMVPHSNYYNDANDSTAVKRSRSSSCTEFTQSHLRHTTPTSPGINIDHCFILTRSESFASDAGILTKLNSMKVKSRAETDGDMKSDRKHASRLSRISKFNHRGSLNLLHKIKDEESCESSMENLGSSGSFGGEVELVAEKEIEAIKRNTLPHSRSSSSIHRARRSVVGSEEMLCKFSSSPHVQSPSRTPVTENDPLGALGGDCRAEVDRAMCGWSSVPRASSQIELDVSGAPALFERRSGSEWPVARSATFTGDSDNDEEQTANKTSIQRSSTMPSNSPDANNSALGSISTSFKLPFTRYSSARFSLRKAAEKAAEIKIGSHLIENAINNFSPSSLTTKKSNEILMGGLSTLKSAATTMVKKFDEIKEAISANNTPIKGGSQRGTLERDACYNFDDEIDPFEENFRGEGGKRKTSSELSQSNSGLGDAWNMLDSHMPDSRKGSSTNLASNPLGESMNWSSQLCILFPKFQRDTSIPVAMQVMLTTCSRCHNCAAILYDEEIMAGWVPEDSNLNTKCQFCDKATVPLLYVTVIDYRCSPVPVNQGGSNGERKLSTSSAGKNSVTLEDVMIDPSSNDANDNKESKTHEPITVPYLNPLVLRKELESILSAEGDSCLIQSKFVDEHPIIYWNMMWVFARLGVESHLGGLALNAAACSINDPDPTWASADSSNVIVSTMWHNNTLNEEAGEPMFLLWNQDTPQQSSLVNALVTDHTTIPRSLMEKVISCLQCSDLTNPLKFLAKERQKCKGRGHSLYRDILFLAMTALGRENIDQAAFDREYSSAFRKVTMRDNKLYMCCDQPLSAASSYCRQYFKPLDL